MFEKIGHLVGIYTYVRSHKVKQSVYQPGMISNCS